MKVFSLILFFFITFNVSASTSQTYSSIKNTLQNHPSPYLALHGSDPVKWQEWNKETIARAKKEGKLLYVSSGYFSCHWCHVMQRESYKNKDIANILNEYFIPVKVDREINSALDSHLIDFVERTQGRAGWPLNVFITPEGYPLVGMTYVPAKNFTAILENLRIRWQLERSVLEGIAKSATNELSTDIIDDSEKILLETSRTYLEHFLLSANNMIDDMSGGFGQENKFPSYPQLNLMLLAYKKHPTEDLKSFLELSLNKMASQGLYDQLDGGFYRYTVDPLWQVPHFEKMLYDNALLASLYIDAAKILKNKKFEAVAKDTLDFLLSVFLSKQGAFIASLSALDDKGIEGGYYLWHREEVKEILKKEELKVVELIWQLEGPDDLDGGHHLVEVMDVAAAAEMLKVSPNSVMKHMMSAKNKMLKLRNSRNIPKDTKLLGAWNALALSAFSKAAKEYDSHKYETAAKNIRDYIRNKLWLNKTLMRAVKNNKVLGEGGLEDYAYLAQGLSLWLEISNNKTDEKWLGELINQAWQRFYTKKGWILSENSLLKYAEGERVISDGVLPSSSAILINVSLSFLEKNNNKPLKKIVLKALNSGHQDIANQPFWYASQIFSLSQNESYLYKK